MRRGSIVEDGVSILCAIGISGISVFQKEQTDNQWAVRPSSESERTTNGIGTSLVPCTPAV
jgi:hypothetical protein